jgi:hypothetical protein
MAYDFPNTPTVGQVITSPSGGEYIWDGIKWTVTGDQGAVGGGGSGVNSWNTRTGAVVMSLGDVLSVGGAPIVSPAFSGTPLAPTAAPGTDTTQIATTAYVRRELNPIDGGSFAWLLFLMGAFLNAST